MTHLLSDPQLWYVIEQAFGKGGGIYLLKCCTDNKASPKPVPRLLGSDTEGVLYIGMALSFLERVIELKKSLSPQHRSRGHECGGRCKDNPCIAEAFPYDKLLVTLVPGDNPRGFEQERLRAYCDRFGELPPLNRAG